MKDRRSNNGRREMDGGEKGRGSASTTREVPSNCSAAPLRLYYLHAAKVQQLSSHVM